MMGRECLASQLVYELIVSVKKHVESFKALLQ